MFASFVSRIREMLGRPAVTEPQHRIPSLSVIKHIVRRLRYQELGALIGKQIVINSLDSVEADVREALRIEYPFIGALNSQSFAFGFRKYGMLDLTFAVGESCPQVRLQEIRFLKQMGFLSDPAKNPFPDAGVGILEELADQVSEGAIQFRLFLKHRDYQPWYKECTLDELLKIDLTQHFPHHFEIVDACLTNADMIWLNKHFYL